MFLGYNTNGLAQHDLFDAVRILARIGYRGVAITIDRQALAPQDKGVRRKILEFKKMLADLGMRSVIETGARFLLDPGVKHQPTLLSADPRPRIEFYKYAIDCAAELGSDCVSLWSGAARGGADYNQAMKQLVRGLQEVLAYAAERGVVIAFEPEPGMLIDSMRRYEDLLKQIDAPRLRLTLDIGHLQCQGETPLAEVIRCWAARLANVHVEDMKSGVHEHLMFGEGEIDFTEVIAALTHSGYKGGIYVELNRHSHEGPQAAEKALAFLSPLLANFSRQT